MTSISKAPVFSTLSKLDELRDAWEQYYPDRSAGGFLALSGFEYQFLLTLLKIVRCWKGLPEAKRQDSEVVQQQILPEAISDIAELGKVVTFTQVKRTLSEKAIRDALEELWEIFNLASEHTPDLVEHTRFVILGKFGGHENPEQVIKSWGTRSKRDQVQKLKLFQSLVDCKLEPDPRADLANELQLLARDEDMETTIKRWLGCLLELGSGLSPEGAVTFIWQELNNDRSLEAFRATLARLFSQSHKRLGEIRCTLGDHINLSRVQLLEVQASVLEKAVTLLTGPSGAGKSALCKLGIQQHFSQKFYCLFLHASDVISFTESADAIANRGCRRLDELLMARIIQKPVLIVIDDLSDVDDQHFDAVLNLLQNTLTASTLTDVRFVLVAHVDARHRIHEQISARFGNNFVYAAVGLPQLPIEELESSKDLPDSITDLMHRHREFGPALNLKLIDWLVRAIQKDQLDVFAFKNDLDLLNWFWCNHVQDGQPLSDLGRALLRIAEELANEFTSTLPCYFDSSIKTETLRLLVQRDCLRVVNEELAVTHRFVGDCARFYYLQGNRRKIESKHLVEWLKNPLWVQPIRWFALQLALESEKSETWQELMCEALKGKHLLLDLLLDGAILSKQPSSLLQGCPDGSLPFVIERLITRLLAIATEPYPFHADGSQSTPLRTRIVIQEQITGIPKADLWEPVWRWLLLQSPETVIGESCIVFRAAEAWLNWSVHAQSFSLRAEVANFTLDLAQTVLLPDPSTENTWEIRYRLRDFESNAFACIVFSLRIIPERSIWFLKALAGREIVSANRLEPRQEITGATPSDDLLRMLRGNGVLQPGHPNGPVAEVNQEFRKFMLSRNGLYLNAVILANPLLGVELFLALTIQPPHYLYEFEQTYNLHDDDLGTAGSDDIDVCTFKFLPLLSLLEINEEVAIGIVETLCRISTRCDHEIDEYLDQQRSKSEGNPEVEELLSSLRTDTYELTLVIDKARKRFYGGRKTLYWHRHNRSPKILACLLMTLEGWLYSRPTRTQLECSILLILKRSNTVAMLGVLVSLAKCDPSLLSGILLPLISSLQLIIWLQFEKIDHGQNFGFDDVGAWNNLLEEESQELLDFNHLAYRTINLQEVIFRLWVDGDISTAAKARILKDWNKYQLSMISTVNHNRALEIRDLFNLFKQKDYWEDRENNERNALYLIDNLLAKSEPNLWEIQHLRVIATCRQILDGKEKKTSDIHRELLALLTNQKQLNSFKKYLKPNAFSDMVWAAITVILEQPSKTLEQELENELNYLANSLSNFPISLDHLSRHQFCNLDNVAFRAHAAPILLKRVTSEKDTRKAAFRRLIGVRDRSTCAFMRSWIREYGLAYPLTQELISIVPRIARLIILSKVFFQSKVNQQSISSIESNIESASEAIEQIINRKEDSHIEEAWFILESDFIENNIYDITISEAAKWTPKMFLQFLQQQPYCYWECFDWDFLAAALIPVFETRTNSNGIQKLVCSLCEQVIFTLLHEREIVYEKHKTAQIKNKNSSIHKHLYQAQSQILDAVIRASCTNILVQTNKLLHALRKSNLIDCILLGHVVDALSYDVAGENINTEINNDSLRNQVAFAIGDYLFEFRNQSASNLRILGKISDVWEKLIELLSLELGDSENIAVLDQFLVQFFNRFQEVLFPHWWLRRKLYHVAKSVGYKQFRRIIFQSIVEHPDLMPNNRNDESESLVQVLAELWDSDCIWIIRQSRCQDLRALLGHLQEIDAVGARSLADQVASFLANPAS